MEQVKDELQAALDLLEESIPNPELTRKQRAIAVYQDLLKRGKVSEQVTEETMIEQVIAYSHLCGEAATAGMKQKRSKK